MSKEYSEALDRLYECNDDDYTLGYQQHDYKLLQQALKRLESIDNAKPSEALEKLDDISYLVLNEIDDLKNKELWKSYFNTIKQALSKAQEQEKENELLKEIIKSLFDRGCPLHQYIDSKGVLQIEVDDECSNMRLGEYKGVDLDKKLKEVLG